MRIASAAIPVILLSLAAVTVAAHHSLPALFDTGKTVTVAGEVTQFQFIAPHAYIHLRVTGEADESIVWELESYPPGMLIRKGLTPATLQVGDSVGAIGYPARDGRPLMRLLTITMPDGEQRQIQ
jgi:hypothetical protein